MKKAVPGRHQPLDPETAASHLTVLLTPMGSRVLQFLQRQGLVCTCAVAGWKRTLWKFALVARLVLAHLLCTLMLAALASATDF